MDFRHKYYRGEKLIFKGRGAMRYTFDKIYSIANVTDYESRPPSYSIIMDNGMVAEWEEYEIKDYFISLQKVRKAKLKKLNGIGK